MDINKILKELDTLDHTQVEDFLNQKLQEAKKQQDVGVEISLLNELIGFCRDTCQHEKNNKNTQELLRILQEQKLEGSQAYATSLLNIANAYRAAGRLEESLEAYRRVYAIYEKLLQPGDFLFASLNNNMSLLYQELHQYENSCECLKKALAIAQNTEDAVIETAITHTNLAQSLLRLNRISEALEHLQKALKIFAEDGYRDYHYSAALSVYAEAKFMLGEYEVSAEYYDKAMQEFEKHMGRGGNYEVLRENRDRALEKMEQQSPTSPIVPNTHPTLGLALCESYYQTHGIPMLHNQFPEYEAQIAVGLVGEGSDCFGFDDEFSRDHDWGPGFCMWISDSLYEKIGEKLQAAYDALPREFMGYVRKDTEHGKNRLGVFTISGFYKGLLGAELPATNQQWLAIPQESLAAAVNGKVFRDDAGSFSRMREALQRYYPETIRQQRLAQELVKMAQTGQYNFGRMLKREDKVTAQMYLGEFLEHTLQTVFLLNKTYAPYEKWLQKGAAGLAILPEITDILRAIADMPLTDEKIPMTIEIIAQLMIEELKRQELVDIKSGSQDRFYLEPYGQAIWNRMKQQEENKMDHDTLMDTLILAEWNAFDKVKNEGGRADCQDDWNTFSIMRKSQYMEWSSQMLESYLNDFETAAAAGWNLITEKYGRMMETTTPEHFEAIKDKLPVLSGQKKAIIEEIVKLQVGFVEELAAEYPKVAGTARSIHTAEDTPYNTSYETYLRGELGTYSDGTLSLYGAFIVDIVKKDDNLAKKIMLNTAHLYGYESLEELESRLE